MKKVFVKSYGCQMNVYDAERMADMLAAEGYSETKAMEEADLVILNTCHIREKAAEKVYSELGRVRELKQERAGPGPGDEGRRRRLRRPGRGQGDPAPRARRRRGGRAAELSPPAGAPDRGRAPSASSTPNSRSRTSSTTCPHRSKAKTRSRGVSAFLTIQEGCDKFCTFCVVPYTRGAEVSRPVAKILDEALRLAEAGVRELTLIGQNVNAYHGEGPDGSVWSLGRLLHRLAEMPGIARLRYTTSHPRDMDDDADRSPSRSAGA